MVLLQRDLERPLTWAPVATWGRRLEMLEVDASLVELELRALCEGFWRLSEFTAYARKLTVLVSLELRALLRVAPKAHPELYA